MSPVKQCRTRGFTLIELLVVIAIIAILAAILFPVLQAAKEKGKAANCSGNMKQLTTALQVYISEFGFWNAGAAYESTADAWWPYVEKSGAGPGNQGYVAGPANRLWIARYCRGVGVVKCPSNMGAVDVYTMCYNIRLNHVKMHYAWDYTMNGGCPGNPNELTHPSRMPAWVEENTDSKIANPYSKEGYGNVINDVTFTGSDITSYRHNDKCNIGYVDGHVGQLPGGIPATDPIFTDRKR